MKETTPLERITQRFHLRGHSKACLAQLTAFKIVWSVGQGHLNGHKLGFH